jgi:hypothetical protein
VRGGPGREGGAYKLGGELRGLNKLGGRVYRPGGELGGPGGRGEPIRAVLFQLYIKKASYRV